MHRENMAKIAINAVRLPKFEPVSGTSWSPRKVMVKDLRQESCVVFNTGSYTVLPDNSVLVTANMHSETGFPSSHQLKSCVAVKIWLKIALNDVRLPKFEPVNGISWSPRKIMVKDLRQRSGLAWFCARAESWVIFNTFGNGFPSSHQLKPYVASKSRLKLAARCPVSGCWPSCLINFHHGTIYFMLSIMFYMHFLRYALPQSISPITEIGTDDAEILPIISLTYLAKRFSESTSDNSHGWIFAEIVYDCWRHEIPRYTGITVFLETVYYRLAFPNTAHPCLQPSVKATES